MKEIEVDRFDIDAEGPFPIAIVHLEGAIHNQIDQDKIRKALKGISRDRSFGGANICPIMFPDFLGYGIKPPITCRILRFKEHAIAIAEHGGKEFAKWRIL